MKKLFTICVLLSIGIGFLRGQTSIPMTVAGNVRNDGDMRSIGPVHLLANSLEKTAKVGNYGTFKMDDEVFFYSNASFDGLLMNKNATANSVQTSQVVVRKTFADFTWYKVSFPFDVNLTNGVLDPTTGMPLVQNSDFYVKIYSGAKRAQLGSDGSQNWVYFPETTLKKGTAYLIAIDSKMSTPAVLDFLSQDNGDPELFAIKQKGISLAYDQCIMFITPENSSGWNALGGLYSTNYEIGGSTIGYAGAVYYIEGNEDYQQIFPKDNGDRGTLRPYAVIFVQTTPTTPLAYTTANIDGGFTYVGDGSGLVLDPNASYPLFRSSSSVGEDLIKLLLTKDGYSSNSKVYFDFNNSYNQSYIPEQGDCIALQTTSSDIPGVWSLVNRVNEDDQKISTFVDCVPYNNNEIPLGVSFPADGNYTFSLKSVNGTTFDKFNNIDLWDAVKGVKCNLLAEDYSFDANSGSTEGRFVLFINKSMTSIDQVSTGDIYAYAENNVLTVKNLDPGDKVQVMDVTGRIVASGAAASGNSYSTPVNQKGVYIVYVKGKALKVLNK